VVVLLKIADCVKVESREGLVLRPEPLQSFPDPVQRYDEAELGEIRADHLLGIFAAMNQTRAGPRRTREHESVVYVPACVPLESVHV
jgi:hypothetical protein